jgi:hypothetical protein
VTEILVPYRKITNPEPSEIHTFREHAPFFSSTEEKAIFFEFFVCFQQEKKMKKELLSGFNTNGYKSLNKAAGGILTKDTKPHRKSNCNHALSYQNLLQANKNIDELIPNASQYILQYSNNFYASLIPIVFSLFVLQAFRLMIQFRRIFRLVKFGKTKMQRGYRISCVK